MILRKITSSDQAFLFEMLYQSIFVKPGSEKPPRSIVEESHLSKYVENWGQSGDFGLIACTSQGKSVGVIWLRFFSSSNRGYGFINEHIPELGMAVDTQYRGQGIGTGLLQTLLDETKGTVGSISLSVQAENRALRLYKRYGFFVYAKTDDSIIMRYDHEK